MGRELASYDDISYTYDENGMRASKTVNGKTTKYYYDGNRLMHIGNGSKSVTLVYDRFDEAIGFFYCGQIFYYVKNLQGDITALISDEGFLMAKYVYDDWGNCTVITSSGTSLNDVANVNPLRYRGYVYDNDTGLYYLQSRYYDPEVGRFINCDDVNYIGVTESEISYNPFAYCENDPVNDSDPSGYASRDSVIKVLKKVLERILNFTGDVVKFLLEKFSVSSKKYIKLSSNGKTPKAIFTFVRKNKSSIKSLKNNVSSIGKFLKIVIEISDLTTTLSKNIFYAKAVAEILFDGFIKLFTYAASKFGAWLITTICKPLKIIRSLIDNVLSAIIEDFFDRNDKVSLIKETYLQNVNCKKISFSNYIYALFKGVFQCV